MAAAGCSCELITLDLTDADSIEQAVRHIHTTAGPVGILVNNAGYSLAGFAEDLSPAEIRHQFETNFFGLVALTRAVLPVMRRRRRGRIINISSVGGRLPAPGFGAYCSSKFAVEGFSESLRYEMLPYNVQVSVIEPGVFATEIFNRNQTVAEKSLDPRGPNYQRTRYYLGIAERRMQASHADPGDVARLVVRMVQSRHPRLRYVIGRDARLQLLIRALAGQRLWEWLVEFMTKPRRFRMATPTPEEIPNAEKSTI